MPLASLFATPCHLVRLVAAPARTPSFFSPSSSPCTTFHTRSPRSLTYSLDARIRAAQNLRALQHVPPARRSSRASKPEREKRMGSSSLSLPQSSTTGRESDNKHCRVCEVAELRTRKDRREGEQDRVQPGEGGRRAAAAVVQPILRGNVSGSTSISSHHAEACCAARRRTLGKRGRAGRTSERRRRAGARPGQR